MKEDIITLNERKLSNFLTVCIDDRKNKVRKEKKK